MARLFRPGVRPGASGPGGAGWTPSAVHDSRVMAEMHVFGSQGADFPDRLAPGLDVAGLAGWGGVAAGLAVLPGRVGRVADEQVECPIPAYDDALVALGVAGGGDHLQAGQHLGV